MTSQAFASVRGRSVCGLLLALVLCLGGALVSAQAKKQIPAPPNLKDPPARARATTSGLSYLTLKAGKGKAHPTETSEVTVNYTGWTIDGKTFDTTVDDRPLTFRLNQAIKGWIEGVPLMTEGERRRFWIPQSLAYQGRPGRPAGMLIFDIELVSFKP